MCVCVCFPCVCVLPGGLTGSGKTAILHRMREEGFQVLDLEVTLTLHLTLTMAPHPSPPTFTPRLPPSPLTPHPSPPTFAPTFTFAITLTVHPNHALNLTPTLHCMREEGFQVLYLEVTLTLTPCTVTFTPFPSRLTFTLTTSSSHGSPSPLPLAPHALPSGLPLVPHLHLR